VILRSARRLGACCGLTLAAAGLAGCVTPAAIDPADRQLRVAAVSDQAATPHDVAWPAQDWWQAIGDAQLAALVERALAGGPTLEAVAARLARARAYADYADANRKPQVNLAGDVRRQLYTENGLYPKPLAGSILNDANLFVTASWELDFFGRNRAMLDAALGQERAAEADVQAARVLIASQVTRAWYQLAWLLEDRALASSIRDSRERVRSLVADRARAGLDSRADLRPLEGAVADASLQIEAIDERTALVRNFLAALTLQPPEAVAALRPALRVRTPPEVPAAVPLDLVGRRADVVAARWRVEASLRDRDAARAQFYPNVNLVALVGLTSLGFDRFTRGSSESWAIGPALRLPIFDAGRLQANFRGRTADVDAAIAGYNAALLDAVRDAADRIAIARAIERQRAEQRAANEAADGALELARDRQAAGLASEIVVLAAELPALAQRRMQSDLTARAIDNEISLIRSLGGGYAETDGAPAD
jgi:NodT family efflux transporter outer membrane factor (OMF) lipoprotein